MPYVFWLSSYLVIHKFETARYYLANYRDVYLGGSRQSQLAKEPYPFAREARSEQSGAKGVPKVP